MPDIAAIHFLFNAQTQNRWKQSQTTANERIARLLRLKDVIQAHEEDIKQAIWQDFRKPPVEVELTEIFPVLQEINLLIRNLKQWMKPQKVSTPLVFFGTRSEIYREARGMVLLISPWNYPFLLSFVPLASAFGAGNCIILKPSEKTPKTSKLMAKMISQVFTPQEVSVVLGGVEESQELLKLPFDHLFFTGSTRVGQLVMKAATEHLSTVTLELGGKSPTIILPDADLEDAADKVVWGRFINGGQTCVAPDHVYVPENLRDRFLEMVRHRTLESYGRDSMARIIDETAFQRLKALFDESVAKNEKLVVGGEFDLQDLYIAPTVVEAEPDSPWMREEIFGPVLPVLTYQNLDDLLALIQQQPKPLALYIFGQDESERILQATSAGASVINNVVIHFANHSVPLGGVGASGQGQYHGYIGFCSFSHQKAVMKQGILALSKMMFPPYEGPAVRFLLWFCKLLVR